MTATYAYCTHCGYEQDIYPANGNYMYAHCGKYFKYPLIGFAWCNKCKKPVAIQEAITNKEICDRLAELQYRLNTLKSKWIKLGETKAQIKSIEEDIEKYRILLGLTEGKDTYASCVECGSVNLVYKDLGQAPWICPKCNNDILKVRDEEDDCLYRLSDIELKPITSKNLGDDFFQIFTCAIDMLRNEGLYWAKVHRILPEFLKSENHSLSVLTRCAYCIAMLCSEKRWNISDRDTAYFLRGLVDGYFKEKPLDLFTKYFCETKGFYEEEIRIMLSTKYFLPGNITFALDNPNKIVKHDFVSSFDDNIERSLTIFNIVNHVFKAYFDKYRI